MRKGTMTKKQQAAIDRARETLDWSERWAVALHETLLLTKGEVDPEALLLMTGLVAAHAQLAKIHFDRLTEASYRLGTAQV
jgi:hypothetical protein